MAEHPITGKRFFFVDKCVPFGASISCALFQTFSDALHFVIEYRTSRFTSMNYLDDFLFIAWLKSVCDEYVRKFIQLCEELNVPISGEKTEWADTLMTFLGVLLDGKRRILSLLQQKIDKAKFLLEKLIGMRKTMVRDLQSLTGLLNFLNRAIVPGRAFTRRIYLKFSLIGNNGKPLKPHHHVSLNKEFKEDCKVWLFFLANTSVKTICRPFVDQDVFTTSVEIDFFKDASKVEKNGFGCIYGKYYTWGQWPPNFIKNWYPSIEYLELFALCIGISVWSHMIQNTRVIIFCDNQVVIHIVNNSTSSYKNCMVLIRMTVLDNLFRNRRVFVKYVKSADNIRSDSLSRLQFD